MGPRPTAECDSGSCWSQVWSLPGRTVARTGHPKAGTFCHLYLRGYFSSLLNRNKKTGFENSGNELSGLLVEGKKKVASLPGGYVVFMLYTVSFGGHVISKW